ncbi:hypothetical protein ACFL35_03150 [Candidatus Riflebacteria bacterium]
MSKTRGKSKSRPEKKGKLKGPASGKASNLKKSEFVKKLSQIIILFFFIFLILFLFALFYLSSTSKSQKPGEKEKFSREDVLKKAKKKTEEDFANIARAILLWEKKNNKSFAFTSQDSLIPDYLPGIVTDFWGTTYDISEAKESLGSIIRSYGSDLKGKTTDDITYCFKLAKLWQWQVKDEGKNKKLSLVLSFPAILSFSSKNLKTEPEYLAANLNPNPVDISDDKKQWTFIFKQETAIPGTATLSLYNLKTSTGKMFSTESIKISTSK